MFEQRQTVGPLISIVLAAALLAVFGAIVAIPWFGVLLVLLLGGIAYVFSAFTVRVGQGVVAWSFRGGMLKWELKLSEIVNAEPIDVPWWYGLGIRLTPRGWYYAVRGGRAVAITRRSGKEVLLGSTAPEELAAVIRQRMSGRTR